MYNYIIVDDEPLTRKGLRTKLLPLSDTVTCSGEASTGEEGIELLKQHTPDFIITDMNMPGMGGNAFLLKIREMLPDIPIIVSSAYKDFDYTHTAINTNVCGYVLKPFSKTEICDAVKVAIQAIERSRQSSHYLSALTEEHEYIKLDYDIQILRSLLLNYQTGAQDFHSNRVKSLCSENNPFVLFILYSLSEIPEESIRPFLIDNELEDNMLYIPQINNSSCNALLFSFAKDQPAYTQPFFRKIALSLINYYGEQNINISVGTSQVKDAFYDLHEAFLESAKALDCAPLCAGPNYYFYASNHNFPEFSWPMEEEFLFRVETADAELVTALIHKLFSYSAQIENLPLGSLKKYIRHLILRGQELLTSYLNVGQNTSPAHSVHILETAFSAEELQDYVTILFTNIRNLIADNNAYSSVDIISQIQLYVQRHYANDLNMDFIASLFYMNRSYLSHLFKKSTGCSFVNYVTGLRIEKAKELLRSTDKKTYQIAKAVGYDNPKYFFRIFKKETGITPEEYRANTQ